MTPESDPRVFFASERTLLAWVRTAIAVIGLGFLVARFGVFVAIIRGHAANGNHMVSTAIGVGLVLLGTFLVTSAAWQHRQFVKGLAAKDLPKGYSVARSVWLSLLLALAAVALAVYLTASAGFTEQ